MRRKAHYEQKTHVSFSIILHHGLWRKERERKSEKERARKRGRKRERENEETQTCNDRTTTVSKSAACILDSFMNVVKKIWRAGKSSMWTGCAHATVYVARRWMLFGWVAGWSGVDLFGSVPIF